MSAAALTFQQVLLMLALILVGVVCARLGWFTEAVGQALSKFLLWFVTPALLLDAYSQPYDPQQARSLLLAGALGVLFHLMAGVLAQLLLRRGSAPERAVARMGAVYSNCGFMAFPLISAVLGEVGVFYGSAFVGVFNLSLWTHGRVLLLGRSGLHLRSALCNAGVLGTLAGLALYFSRLSLPGLAAGLVSSLASLNTPLAMLVIGIFLARCPLRSLCRREVIWPALLRVAVLPLCFLGLLCLLQVGQWGADGPSIGLVVMLCASCPSAASSVLMTASLGMDSAYGARIILLTSLLSVLTIPLLSLLASSLLL